MDRYARALVAALTLFLLLAAPVAAVKGIARDSRGPTCTDIIGSDGTIDSGGSYTYNATTGTGTVTFQLVLAGTSCTDVTYTLYILDEATSTTATSAWTVGDGTSNVIQFWNVAVSTTDADVCVYATTTKGAKLYDRAPDATPRDPSDVECVLISASESGAGSRFG